jgi:TolA-binding protein
MPVPMRGDSKKAPELRSASKSPSAPLRGDARVPPAPVSSATVHPPGRAQPGEVPAATAPARAPAAERAEPPDAEHLFEAARVQRSLGQVAEAAALLETLLARFPGSAQEGLAAFELARLRMDQLGAPEAAVAPLTLAVSRLPSAALREDAAARLVQLDAKLGRIQACAEARSEYLQRFPRGIHRPSVELLCPPGSP